MKTPTVLYPVQLIVMGNKTTNFPLGLIPFEDNYRSECYMKVHGLKMQVDVSTHCLPKNL